MGQTLRKRRIGTRRIHRGRGLELERMFPEKEGVKYTELKMTPEGEYSITRRNDGKKLLQKMISVIGNPKRKTITDLTGNVGGDTILFGLNFKHVNSIELNPENFEALEHNVSTFKLHNVTLHKGDSTKLYNWKTDVLYLDPPWGGPSYKEKKELDLYLGNERVDEYLAKILKEEWRPKYIFMKVPFNYNFKRLDELPHITQKHKFQIRSFYLIGLKTEKVD